MIAECERFWFMYQYLSTGQRKPHKRHQSYTLVVFFYSFFSFFWLLLLLFVIKVAPCLDSNLAYFYHIHMTICIYLLYSVYGLNCLNPPKCYRKAKNRQSDVLSIIVIHHFVPGLQRLYCLRCAVGHTCIRWALQNWINVDGRVARFYLKIDRHVFIKSGSY